jgi:hypothetical protein
MRAAATRATALALSISLAIATTLAISINLFADSPFPPWLTNLHGDISVSPAGSVTVLTSSTPGNSTITSAMIVDNTITADDINTSAVTTTEILDATVATADIANNAITTALLATGSVTESDILDGTITEPDIYTHNANGRNLARNWRYEFTYSSQSSPGTFNTGNSIPANAIITKSWANIITQFQDDGSGTIAIYCEDSNNILSPTDLTGYTANQMFDLNIPSNATAGSFVTNISALCAPQIVVAGANLTAGKMTIHLEYVLAD